MNADTDKSSEKGQSDREEIDHDEPYLDEREESAVSNARSLSAISVYTVVHAEGVEEMERPLRSLWWSGIAAGLGIATSVLAEGILHRVFEGSPYQHAFENMGYTIGFMVVILGKMQLFTENTITPVLPLLRKRTSHMAYCMARLWGVVFLANMVGCYVTALFTYLLEPTSPENMAGMMAISEHYAEFTAYEGLIRGVPAGFLVAALVWMLPSSKGFEIFTIFVMTYLIALGDFTHVVAGSVETALVLFDGGIGVGHAIALTAGTLLGNVIGGTVLFAFLAYGQVVSELDEREHQGRLAQLSEGYGRR